MNNKQLIKALNEVKEKKLEELTKHNVARDML